MIDLGIIEKIRTLKVRFTGGDVADDAKWQISEWEKLAQKLSLDQDFFTHARTQEIFKALKERIKAIMLLRLKAKTTEELRLLDAQEEECKGFIALFNPNWERELESLERIIDAELA